MWVPGGQDVLAEERAGGEMGRRRRALHDSNTSRADGLNLMTRVVSAEPTFLCQHERPCQCRLDD